MFLRIWRHYPPYRALQKDLKGNPRRRKKEEKLEEEKPLKEEDSTELPVSHFEPLYTELL